MATIFEALKAGLCEHCVSYVPEDPWPNRKHCHSSRVTGMYAGDDVTPLCQKKRADYFLKNPDQI